MAQLEFVSPSDEGTINTLLYGPPKSGKTTGACSGPGPVMLVNADRPNASRYAHAKRDDIREVKATGLQTLIDVAEALQESAEDWGTVVVDPVGELYTVLLEDLSGRAVRPQINLRGDASVHLERFFRMLCEVPVNVVFTAHDWPLEEDDAVSYRPWTGTKNPSLGNKLMAAVDIIGYTGVVQAEDGDQADDRYMATLANARGRFGGDRFGGVLGRSAVVNISEWQKLAQEATKPADNGGDKE